jgi:zinc transporter ZupT
MAYFSRGQDGIERVGKILADVFSAALLLAFAVAFFGWLGGAIAFVILEAGLLAIEYVLPGDEADAAGVVR